MKIWFTTVVSEYGGLSLDALVPHHCCFSFGRQITH